MTLFSSVFLAVVYASAALAAPWPLDAKHTTHRKRELRGGKKIVSFSPPATFETFGKGLDRPPGLSSSGFEDTGVDFIKSKTGITDVTFKSGFNGGTVKATYARQTHEGVPFSNAVAHVAFGHDDKIVAFGSNFVKPSTIAPSKPTIAIEDAIKTAEKELGGTHNGHPPSVEYLAQQDGSAALAHVIQIQNDAIGLWQQAFIDAHTGKLLSINDFVADASYRVLPITKEFLTDGTELLTDPQDTNASPSGWHDDGTTKSTGTAGNNVVAYKGADTAITQQSADGVFDFKQDPAQDPTVAANLDAARTNAFYLVNSVHDIAYEYGFTEATFNFQNNNFNKGGQGNDRVRVSVQDSAGKDNADFSTPPDGQSGQMRMFIFDVTTPNRDGALENDIVVHENTHGISNRLTGGGTATCLQTLEAGGMGEGWSDAMAEWTEHKDGSVPDYSLGNYVINSPAGIRTHPYSTSATTNPLRYSNLATLDEVHDIGEVWANTLHNVYAALVGAKGWSAKAHTDSTTGEGNVIWLHLFIDSLSIQPCEPTFLTARDAWIQADANRYNGANKCVLWNAFASRGLGVKAADHKDDGSVPDECSGTGTGTGTGGSPTTSVPPATTGPTTTPASSSTPVSSTTDGSVTPSPTPTPTPSPSKKN